MNPRDFVVYTIIFNCVVYKYYTTYTLYIVSLHSTIIQRDKIKYVAFKNYKNTITTTALKFLFPRNWFYSDKLKILLLPL